QVKAKIRFLPLLTGTIDVRLRIDNPQLAATSQQVDSIHHTPIEEAVKEGEVSWQHTLRNMVPVRISLLLSDGEVRYHSDPRADPIQLHALHITAGNVTNRPSENGSYPSELHVHAHLADDAEVNLKSHVDLLAKPSPRLEGDLNIQHLTL